MARLKNDEWYANRDFDFHNLTVAKGGRLPDAWQNPQNAKYLKTLYGEHCIVRKTAAATELRDKRAWVPCRADTQDSLKMMGG